MSRAERRRAEREAKKQNQIKSAAVNNNVVGTALLKKQLTDQIDRELGNRYYQQACKDACDNSYYILLCSMALALKDCNPAWGSEAIGKRLQLTMNYVDRFANEYDGDIKKYLKDVEERTDLIITVDSKEKQEVEEKDEF